MTVVVDNGHFFPCGCERPYNTPTCLYCQAKAEVDTALAHLDLVAATVDQPSPPILRVAAADVQVGDRVILDAAQPTVTHTRRTGWDSVGADTRVEFTFDMLQDPWDPEGGPARMNYDLTDQVDILRPANRKAAA